MKKMMLTLAAIAGVALLLLHCGGSGSSSSTPPVTAQSFSVAFLQQKPNSNLLYPVLGKLSGSQFTTSMIKDPSTGNYVSAAIGSIILSAKKDKAVLEVYGGTDNATPTTQWDIFVGTIDGPP